MSFKVSTNTTSVGTTARFGAVDINLITRTLNGETDVANVTIDSPIEIQNAKLTVASITNVDEVIIPDGPTSLIGNDTTDTLENKTLDSPTINTATIATPSISDASISGTTTVAGGSNIILDTSTGTKIGTSTNQKLGFYNATPVTQRTGIADVDSSTVDATYGAEEQAVITSLRTKLNAVLQILEDLGLTSVA